MTKQKILLVDDSQTVRTKVTRVLVGAGYEVIPACNGLEAINLLEVEKPSLIILDVNMPILDGYGFCARLREAGPDFEAMPVIFLTSLKTQAIELLGREFGDYISKPFTNDELLSAIEQQLAQLT